MKLTIEDFLNLYAKEKNAPKQLLVRIISPIRIAVPEDIDPSGELTLRKNDVLNLPEKIAHILIKNSIAEEILLDEEKEELHDLGSIGAEDMAHVEE